MLEDEAKNQGSAYMEENKVEDLKHAYLDQLFISQIKWASSTIREKSNLPSSIYSDSRLRELIQRFPDTFLLMYNPIFQLKKAKVQLETLMITPSKLICISFVDHSDDDGIYIGSIGHFWQKKNKSGEMKVLNPVISIRRMEHIVKQIFQISDSDLPIEKVVIAKKGYITHQNPPDDVLFIDKQDYESWINELRSYTSPMKMMQFRAAKALLERCARTKVRRADGVPPRSEG